MAERKETPDVLGELLGGPAAPAEPNPPLRPDPPLRPGPPSRPVPPKAGAPQQPTAAPSEPRPSLKLAPPKTAKPTANVVQWEYTQIVFYDYAGWRPRSRDGAELPNWKNGPSMDATLQQLGEEGWEMAGIVPGQHNQWHAFFKRPQA